MKYWDGVLPLDTTSDIRVEEAFVVKVIVDEI